MKTDAKANQPHCRTDCVNTVLNRLCPGMVTIKGVKIKDTLATIKYLQAVRLEVKIFLPSGACFLPFTWRLLFRHWRDVYFSKAKLALFAERFQEMAYIYHLAPDQLYGYSGAWTHCVSEIFIGGQREFFDGIEPEYFRVSEGFEWPPSHQTLIKNWGVVICVGAKIRN